MYDFGSGKTGMNIVLDEISEVAGFLWQKGWGERNAGNISWNLIDIPHNYASSSDFGQPEELIQSYSNLANHFILVTGTGTRMRDVMEKPAENCCIVWIDRLGGSYRVLSKTGETGKLKPTSELSSHLAIHEMLVAKKRNERVIVHTHPNNLIALTHIEEFCDEGFINRLLWSIQPETCIFVNDGLGFVKYLMTGTDELALATIHALREHRVVMWEKHGCLAIGKNPGEAFDLIDILDKSASIFFACKNAGYRVDGINETDLNELRKAYGVKVI